MLYFHTIVHIFLAWQQQGVRVNVESISGYNRVSKISGSDPECCEVVPIVYFYDLYDRESELWPCSCAGTSVFGGRRWLDPNDPMDWQLLQVVGSTRFKFLISLLCEFRSPTHPFAGLPHLAGALPSTPALHRGQLPARNRRTQGPA